VTKELFEAAQQLINLEERFGGLIPEIGCQFVYSVENSALQEDIAGFPGRIIRVKGKGRIISPPEFGQSSTLALILSFFQQQGSQHRTIISLKRTPTNLKLLTQGKHVVYTEEADKNWEKVLKSFSKEEIIHIEVIADSGGVGFEPHLYLLGTNPLEITKYIISRLQ
jgi:predicted fused transcriptional regulator/phosphomethylpyrimidine kinase